MNLYLISQTVNEGYDTYDSAVVCAANEESARKIHPSGQDYNNKWYEKDFSSMAWAPRLADVSVRLIGQAAPNVAEGVVCASFNAG